MEQTNEITKTEVLSKRISVLNAQFDNGFITLSQLESMVEGAIEEYNCGDVG